MDEQYRRQVDNALAQAQIGTEDYKAILRGELNLSEAKGRQHGDEAPREEIPDCGFEIGETAWMKVQIVVGLENKLSAVPFINGELPDAEKRVGKGVFAHKATLEREVPTIEKRRGW